MSTFEYPVQVDWNGGRTGSGKVHLQRSDVQFGVSVPVEFQGPGIGTNPEELLASAIVSCYCITFGIIATNRKLPVEHILVDAIGVVEQNGATFTYREVTIKPKITVFPSADEVAVQNVYEMAIRTDQYCIVGNAVRDKVLIKIEPEVCRSGERNSA